MCTRAVLVSRMHVKWHISIVPLFVGRVNEWAQSADLENLQESVMLFGMTPLRILKGDATSPQAKGPKIIAHACNDIGGWGAGFVVAVSKRRKERFDHIVFAIRDRLPGAPAGRPRRHRYRLTGEGVRAAESLPESLPESKTEVRCDGQAVRPADPGSAAAALG